MTLKNHSHSGILLIDKSPGTTSFHIVHLLRKITRIEKIGHAGTLDPFATGVMVMLVGREYTQKSDSFLTADKQYRATMRLGISTDTYDTEGQVIASSALIPSREQIDSAIASFQGEVSQVPPMFSAKKIDGKKLCDLARRGITVERKAVMVRLKIEVLRFEYPFLEILIDCSKGTYIRSLAHDLGNALGCGAHLSALSRTRSGAFTLGECIPQDRLKDPTFDIAPHLRRL